MKADYLEWGESGTHVPALATTGPTRRPSRAGKTSRAAPGTAALFGNDYINNKAESGGGSRRESGSIACHHWFRGRVLRPGRREHRVLPRWSDGNPIIARPFNDVNPVPSARPPKRWLFPAASRQFRRRDHHQRETRFHGARAHFVFTVCRQEGCWSNDRAPARPTTTASARTSSPVIGIWSWRINSAYGNAPRARSPSRSMPTNPDGTQDVSAFPDPRSVQHAELVQRRRSGHEVRISAESLVVGCVPAHRLGLDALDGRYQRLDADHHVRPATRYRRAQRRPAGPVRPRLEHRPLLSRTASPSCPNSI